MRTLFRPLVAAAVLAALAVVSTDAQESFRFRSGVELVNVTATVTDQDGRFVSGLRQEDFTVYEDGEQQEVSHFSNERVPVSLGIALDTSGSMTPDKMSAARGAIDRFIYDLLGPDDELFFMQFANRPDLIQDWTTDRRRISRAVDSVGAAGGTAMYDAIADAIPVAQQGKNRKKALLVISDGNDTGSGTSVGELRQMIRESEVLVYALGGGRHRRGLDAQGTDDPAAADADTVPDSRTPAATADAAADRRLGRHLERAATRASTRTRFVRSPMTRAGGRKSCAASATLTARPRASPTS